MTAFDRIKELCKKRGMTLQELAEKNDMSINALYKWRKSMPSADKLKKVADYLGVSVDYLLSGEDKTSKLDPAEDKIVTMFRKNTAGMTEEEKEEFNESMDKLMSVAKDLFERDKKK